MDKRTKKAPKVPDAVAKREHVVAVTYTTKHGNTVFVAHVGADLKDNVELGRRFACAVLATEDIGDYYERKPDRACAFMKLVAQGRYEEALRHWSDDQHNRNISWEYASVERIRSDGEVQVAAREWLKANPQPDEEE